MQRIKQKQNVRSLELRSRAIMAAMQPLENRVMMSAAGLKPAHALLVSTTHKSASKPVITATSLKLTSKKTTTKDKAATKTSTSGGVKPSLTADITQTFTPGDLVVYQVGTGTALTSAAAPVTLDEFTPTSTSQTTPVVSDAFPTSGSTALTATGTTKQEGLITDSANGAYLVVPGYTSSSGTAAPYGVSGNQEDV